MKTLKKRVIRRSAYLLAFVVLVLTGCGVGRYNNQAVAMTWPTNTTYYYNSTAQYTGSSVSYK